jgi:hypothetical protein
MNSLLDYSLTGKPFHTLRGAAWNIKRLGFFTWLCFFARNARTSVNCHFRTSKMRLRYVEDLADRKRSGRS